MDTISAVKNRILQLCGERNISVNRLASISALPPSSVKNILYGKSVCRFCIHPYYTTFFVRNQVLFRFSGTVFLKPTAYH